MSFSKERSAVFYKGDKTLISEIFNYHNHDWVYANEANQFSLFLCNRIFTNRETETSSWSKFVEVRKLDEWKNIDSRSKVDRQQKHYFSLNKNFMSCAFSSCYVDVFSRVHGEGKYHYRQFGTKGLYLPKEKLRDGFILETDLADFFFKFLIQIFAILDAEPERAVKSVIECLIFCRENDLLTKSPFHLHGVILGLSKIVQKVGQGGNDISSHLELLKENYQDFPMELEALISTLMLGRLGKQLNMLSAALYINMGFNQPNCFFARTEQSFSQAKDLSSQEKELALTHADFIAKKIKLIVPSNLELVRLVRHHHGSQTGRGFPEFFRGKIQADDITFMAVIAIAEAFCELRPGETVSHALSKIKGSIPQAKLKKEVEDISRAIF